MYCLRGNSLIKVNKNMSLQKSHNEYLNSVIKCFFFEKNPENM